MDYPGQVNPLDATQQFADKGTDDVFIILCGYFSTFLYGN